MFGISESEAKSRQIKWRACIIWRKNDLAEWNQTIHVGDHTGGAGWNDRKCENPAVGFRSQYTAGLNTQTSVRDGVRSMFYVRKTGRQWSTQRKSAKCGDESQEANIPGSIIGSIKRGDHTL